MILRRLMRALAACPLGASIHSDEARLNFLSMSGCAFRRVDSSQGPIFQLLDEDGLNLGWPHRDLRQAIDNAIEARRSYL